MKILVVSNTPWSVDNSFGNSFTNIFEGIDDVQFVNVYCRYGTPNNQFDMKCFQITEKMLLANLLCKQTPSGKIIEKNCNESFPDATAVIGFEHARKARWQIMFWARDLIWKIGRWDSRELKRFINDNKPDLIFQPIYYSNYICRIALRISEMVDVPMIGYISDDCYTLRQFKISPMYWIDRLIKRRNVKALIEKCRLLYVISEIQKREYEQIFSPPCKILTKVNTFDKEPPTWNVSEDISMIYAGNLGNGRAKSLGHICKAVARLKTEGKRIHLDIYSNTPLTYVNARRLRKEGCTFHPAIPYKDLLEKQKMTDILVHVEGLSLKSRFETHQSFSTKLVDFFSMGKCVFAVGKDDEASIAHLLKNDAAVVAMTKKEVYQKLKQLVCNPDEIIRYGIKAYECGRKNHRKDVVQTMLIEDLKGLIK